MFNLHPLVLGLAAIGLVAQLGVESPEKPSEPPKQLSSDPKGWRDFHWDMSKQQAHALGAETFVDRQGEEHFGLAEVEILPEKNRFSVDLQFFSHIGLSGILVKLNEHTICAEDEYATLLRHLRGKYGDEKETKKLDFPNTIFLSHVWIVRTTKITLHHSCKKPSSSPSSSNNNKSFLTSVHFEKRLFIELWDR